MPPTRGLPTSRAYWELKAEQMMNRVFSPETAIDLDPISEGSLESITLPPPSRREKPRGSQQPPTLAIALVALLGGMGLAGALGAVLLARQWTGLQNTLSQERNLLLVERLRALGPASGGDVTAMEATTPPPPVLDPIQPAQPISVSQGVAPPLRVPVSPLLRDAAPPASTSEASRFQGRSGKAEAPSASAPSGAPPQLVGLVGAPGRAGSAIFQIGETSTNVNVGEPIGASGWRLRAADADSALIERGSELRRISILAGG